MDETTDKTASEILGFASRIGACECSTCQGVRKRAELEKNKKEVARVFTVLLDLDGVLAQYDGWKGEDVIGEPMLGAREAVMQMRKMGWRVIVWTTRKKTRKLTDYLFAHFGFSQQEINTCFFNPPDAGQEKPLAHVYVDDRGLRFEGDWGMTMLVLIDISRDKPD